MQEVVPVELCLAYAVPLKRTKKASPKKEKTHTHNRGICSDVGAASESVVHVCLAYAVL
jgi:hypothetical protein